MLTPFPAELRWPLDEDVVKAQTLWDALLVELRKPEKVFPICIELKEANPIVVSLLSDQCARETESGYSFLLTDKTLTCEPWREEPKAAIPLIRKTKFLSDLPTEVYTASQQDREIAEKFWLQMVNNIRGAEENAFPLNVKLGLRANRRVLKVLREHIVTQKGYGYEFSIHNTFYDSLSLWCYLTKQQ
jgi:predicted  nucleic acid-binding Zn ribbon protein